MEEDGQTTPFWLQQSSTYFRSSNNRRRQSRSSICLNSGVLIVVLVVLAIVTIFIVIPSFLAFTSQVFKPNLVRKSWDGLNLVLVLFAILCGILGRRRDDGEAAAAAASGAVEEIVPEAPRQEEPAQQHWFGYSDNRRDDNPIQEASSNVVNRGRLKRNSSSYPDLRQESSWASPNDNNWRYFDDSYVYNRRLGSDYVNRQRHQRDRGEEVVQESGVKTIPVDTYQTRQQEVSSPPEAPQPSTPPPPPPPPRRPLSEMKAKVRHDFQSVGERENIRTREMEFKKTTTPPPPPPPPPAPVLSPATAELRSSKTEKKYRKHERKKSGGAKDITSTLASLYNQRKRKKKTKSKENFDDVFYSPANLYSGPPPSPPPPPPPPPPPASVFQQLFKKGSKSKKIHSLSASSIQQRRQAPPPPPPPPPPMSPLHQPRRTMPQPSPMPQPPSAPPPPPAPPSQPSRTRKPMTPGKPPLPSKINSFYEESYNAGNQSPLIPMPPPPPPPPFKVPGFRFVVKGDYVRLLSNQSSRSNSPDLDSTETPPTSTPATPTRTDDGEAGASVFCPSPDVNTKADTFIARFRAGLRMEKVHSFEKQEPVPSGLKPSPRSSPNQIQT